VSFRALAAAVGQAAPSASAKLVLVVLAGYAGEDGACFPSQARVAADAQLSLRTVRDAYRDLKAAGLIETTSRRRADGSRTTDLVRLTFPIAPGKRRAAPVDRRQMAPSPAAAGAGPEPAREPAGEGPEGPPSDAGAAGEDWFEQAWAAYPEGGRQTSSRRQARGAWAAELKGGGDGRAMARAAGVYAAERARWGRSGSPLAFHNFLSLGRWVECVAAAGQGPSPEARAPFDGPAEVAQALRAGLGEAGFASWTAGATWRAGARAVAAPTRLAAGRLRDRCGAELRRLGVAVEDPPAEVPRT
jgi:hypothetical protein